MLPLQSHAHRPILPEPVLHDAARPQSHCCSKWQHIRLGKHRYDAISIVHARFLQSLTWVIQRFSICFGKFQKSLLDSAFTHRRICTEKLLHTEDYTRKSSYTQRLLHREDFPQRSLYTGKLLRRKDFTRRSLYTSDSYTGKILHREAFTQRSLATEQPCDVEKLQFYFSFCRPTIILCEKVAPEVVNLHFNTTLLPFDHHFVQKGCI